MKVVHYLYDHPENPWLGGGGGVRAFKINQYLVKLGVDVTMICGGFPKARDYTDNFGIKYRFTSNESSYFKSRLKYGIQCRSLAKDLSCDLVIDDFSPFTFSMPYLTHNQARLTIIHHLYGQQMFTKFGVLGFVFYLFEKFNLKRYANVITVSDSTRRHLNVFIPSKKLKLDKVIPAGVDDDYLNTQPATKKDYILSLGRIEIFNKGLDILLDSFSQVYKKHPELKLKIAGGGREEEELRLKISTHSCSDAIEYLGRVSEDQKLQLLNEAKFLVMPSRYEGWGMVAMEAASLGTTVAATNIIGLNEAVQHRQTGLLSEVNPHSFSDAILELWEDEKLRKNLEVKARDRAFSYSWSETAKKTFNFYQSTVNDFKASS